MIKKTEGKNSDGEFVQFETKGIKYIAQRNRHGTWVVYISENNNIKVVDGYSNKVKAVEVAQKLAQDVEKGRYASMDIGKELRRIAKELESSESWEKCIEDSKKNPDVDDPEALCGWLKSHGPNAPKGDRKGPFKASEKVASHIPLMNKAHDNHNQTFDAWIETLNGKPVVFLKEKTGRTGGKWSWYLNTLDGTNGFGKVSDKLYLDQGQNWFVTGMKAITEEAKSKV